jgi:hypothetical protein
VYVEVPDTAQICLALYLPCHLPFTTGAPLLRVPDPKNWRHPPASLLRQYSRQMSLLQDVLIELLEGRAWLNPQFMLQGLLAILILA